MGGRLPIDPVVMLKILIRQAVYCLSDGRRSFQIIDRSRWWIQTPRGPQPGGCEGGAAFVDAFFRAWVWWTGVPN